MNSIENSEIKIGGSQVTPKKYIASGQKDASVFLWG
jgi:hypothetical protein